MRRLGVFSLEIAVSLVLNLTASLFDKPQAMAVSKWGWLVVLLHGTYLCLSTDTVKRHAVRLRSNLGGHVMLSYLLVGMASAALGTAYWAGINGAFAKLFPGGRAPRDAQPEIGDTPITRPQSSTALAPATTVKERPIHSESPIEGLTKLGWNVVSNAEYPTVVNFQKAKSPLPDMARSALLMRKLKGKLDVGIIEASSLAGLSQLSTVGGIETSCRQFP